MRPAPRPRSAPGTPATHCSRAAPRSWCSDWCAGWNDFWFTPADPLPLDLIRIATGLLLTWSCVVWLLDADAFFGDRGWLRPDQVWRMNDQPWQ